MATHWCIDHSLHTCMSTKSPKKRPATKQEKTRLEERANTQKRMRYASTAFENITGSHQACIPREKLQTLGQWGVFTVGSLSPRQRNVQKTVKPARTKHGLVDELRPVGGGNHEDVLSSLQPVHLCQQLVHLTRIVRQGSGTAAREVRKPSSRKCNRFSFTSGCFLSP